ncbi:Beta-glucosidase [Neofusicoccum parvum]|nr:Beta-glucosidase [Neofusicoccum parvum]
MTTTHRISHLLSSLTLDEKLSLLAGESQWRTATIPRLQVPSLKVSDGPSGARGEIFGEGVAAAFIPSGVSLGATWDVNLLKEIGQHLAEECKSKSASVLLAPTMCIHRHPLGGRNFESFSEDPFLTGKLATAHVQGLQSRGVGATPKHFVANDQETKRFKVNAHIPLRALREVYLLPFQMVVRDADPWCMMTAYNKVNGVHCDASKELLIDIARDEWKWNGVFMSDWGGTNSTVESINGGLDLEMPGPPAKRSREALEQPLEDGLVDLNRVNQAVSRILQLLQRAGRFENASDEPEYCRDMDDPACSTRELLRRAAASGIVMLKNDDNALPLKLDENISKIAVVGPNAKRVVAGGGGSSYIKAPYWTSVFDSIKSHFDKQQSTQVVFHTGAKVNRYVPTVSPAVVRNPYTGKSGASLDWHLTHNLATDVVAKTHIDDLYFMGFGDVPPEIGRLTEYSFTAHALLTPQTTGTHKISLASIGPAMLYIDDELVLEQSGAFEEKDSLFFGYGSGEAITSRDMVAGRDYQIRIDYHSHDRQLQEDLAALLEPMEDKFQGFRLGFEEFDPSDLPAETARLAQDADAALVVVGRDKEWETESQDIPFFELPGEQVRLIQEVSAVCKRTIVVVQAGTPVLMDPWIDNVQAVLYTWYQGQELGNAAADVICGQTNPSGRLPVTFPRKIQDCPAYSSFPGELSESHYSEGLYVGYRWWDLVGTKPHFPIGFGLSYSTFRLKPETISSTTLLQDTVLKLGVQVENTGGSPMPGRETVIIWFSEQSPRRLVRPVKQICGFAKSSPLKPGETELVEVEVEVHALGMFDPKRGNWIIDAGTKLEILVGTNAEDAVAAWQVEVSEEITWIK